jgi:hypothetical protein
MILSAEGAGAILSTECGVLPATIPQTGWTPITRIRAATSTTLLKPIAEEAETSEAAGTLGEVIREVEISEAAGTSAEVATAGAAATSKADRNSLPRRSPPFARLFVPRDGELQFLESRVNQYVFCSSLGTTAGAFTALTDG